MLDRRLKDMEWTLPSPKWIFVFNILLFLLRVSLAKTLATIHWNKNANFGTEGLELQAEINDVVEIECPKTPNTTTGRQFAQYLTFTQVSQEGFNTCSTTSGTNARDLLMCNRPFEDNSYLLLFQRDSPFPGGITFRHSRTYYFITTSDGSFQGLHRQERGLCHTHHMKVKVHIKPRPTEATPIVTPARTRPPTRPPTRTTRPTTLPTTTQPQTTVTPLATEKTDVVTKPPRTKKPDEKNSDTQSSDNASTTLRHSGALLFAGSFIAMLRWRTMT